MLELNTINQFHLKQTFKVFTLKFTTMRKKATFSRWIVLMLCFGLFPVVSKAETKKTDSFIYSDSELSSFDLIQIEGTVTDQSGQPLIGVSILIKGSSRGTATDSEGKFILTNVDENATLIFSYLGFKSTEFSLNGRTVINIVLEEDLQSLEEVVVTALGIRKEAKALGYSVTKIDGQEFIKIRENNFANSLHGLVAGVNVSGSTSGMGGSSRVTIRGNTSIDGDNQPLYVINGLPMNNTQFGHGGSTEPDWGDNISAINPDDIEELTVLKGATAAALYGSRAKNGAIIITTKTGSKQQGIGVEFNNSTTLDVPYFIWEIQDVYGQGYGNKRPVSIQDAANHSQNHWGEPYDGVPTYQYDGVMRPYSFVKDQVLKDFYETGLSMNSNISFSGGGDKGTFRVGLSDMRSSNVVPNSNMTRNNINLGLTQQLISNLSITAHVDYFKEDVLNRDIIQTRSNPTAIILFINSNMPTSALSPGYDENFYEIPSGTDHNATNPYFATYRMRNESSKDRFLTSMTAKWDIRDWLFLRGKVGQDYYTYSYENIKPDGTAFLLGGSIDETHMNFWERNYELLLGMDKKLSQNFNFSANLGGNMMSQYSYSTTINGLGFVIPQLHVVNNTLTKNTSTKVSQRKTNSIFATSELSFRDFLYLNLTGRNDWFSTLNPKSNNYFYPSAGISFIFSELFNMPKFIDFGKFRLAYASVGGDTSPYRLNLTYGLRSYTYNDRPLGIINQSIVPNSNLRPLSVNELEAGFDFKLFNNRVGLDVAVYNKQTTNDIATETITTTSGYSGVSVNVGELRNRGAELFIRGTPILNRNFSWDITANMAYNKNIVLKISNEASELVLRSGKASIKLIEGMEYAQISGRTILKNEKGEEIIDETGLPIVPNDIVNFGSGIHKWTGGLSNTFTYKTISLSFLIDGKFGAKIYSETSYDLDHRGMSWESLLGRKDGVILPGVTEDGQPNTVFVDADRAGNRAITVRRRNAVDDYLYNASFIKLRNVSLTYQIPQNIIRSTNFFQSASLSLIGNNLMLLMNKAKNIDPDTNYTTGNAQGVENSTMPQIRSIGLNLNFKF